MWVPHYRNNGKMTGKTNVAYAIDLVRGLDVYTVDLPGARNGKNVKLMAAQERPTASRRAGSRPWASCWPPRSASIAGPRSAQRRVRVRATR